MEDIEKMNAQAFSRGIARAEGYPAATAMKAAHDIAQRWDGSVWTDGINIRVYLLQASGFVDVWQKTCGNASVKNLTRGNGNPFAGFRTLSDFLA